jgi:thiamine pyrophosphokinase
MNKGAWLMHKRCFIVGAGDYSGAVAPGSDDYIIAADGGYKELLSRGMTPHLVVGDFDSLGYVPIHPHVMQNPIEKDDTDMMIAVRQGLKIGYKTFIIDGGMGGRLDHTLANFQILVHIAERGARGYLLGRDFSVTAIKNDTVRFADGATGRVSVFCFGDVAKGVALKGLRYPLNNATLTCAYPLGVSNEFTGVPASITVRDGTLIAMWTGGLEVMLT